MIYIFIYALLSPTFMLLEQFAHWIFHSICKNTSYENGRGGLTGGFAPPEKERTLLNRKNFPAYQRTRKSENRSSKLLED